MAHRGSRQLRRRSSQKHPVGREAKATASYGWRWNWWWRRQAKPQRCLISGRQSAEQELNRTRSGSTSAAPCSACTIGCSSGGWPPMATPPTWSSPATTASANWPSPSRGSESGRPIADAPSRPPSSIRALCKSPPALFPHQGAAPGRQSKEFWHTEDLKYPNLITCVCKFKNNG